MQTTVVLLGTYSTDLPCMAILPLTYITVLYMSLIIEMRPYANSLTTYLQLFNLTAQLIICYLLMFFTDFVDLETSLQAGNVFIYVLLAVVAANCGFQILPILFWARLKLKVHLHRRKLMERKQKRIIENKRKLALRKQREQERQPVEIDDWPIGLRSPVAAPPKPPVEQLRKFHFQKHKPLGKQRQNSEFSPKSLELQQQMASFQYQQPPLAQNLNQTLIPMSLPAQRKVQSKPAVTMEAKLKMLKKHCASVEQQFGEEVFDTVLLSRGPLYLHQNYYEQENRTQLDQPPL